MNVNTMAPGDPLASRTLIGDPGHAVSWGAILAGAAAAAALSLILLVLGTGLGLAMASPWTDRGASATTMGVSTITWICFVAIVASGVGGYLAGRLRTKWVAAHTDEVYFRDTAHGLLAWAVATLLTAALLTSATGSILSVGVQTAGAALGATGQARLAGGTGMAASSDRSGPEGSTGLSYYTDSLFRPAPAASAAAASAAAASAAVPSAGERGAQGDAQANRIFLHGLAGGGLAQEDLHYLGQSVASRTGLSQQDAERRVNDAYAKVSAAEQEAKAGADRARKAAAYASLWIFVSLLLGAFTASLLATIGGRQRDL